MRRWATARTMILIVAAAAMSACGGSGGESVAEEAIRQGETPEEAIARWGQAIEANSQDVRALNSRGRVYFGLGQFQRAVEDFNESVFWQQHAVSTGGSTLTEVEFSDLFRDLGLAHFKLGDMESAIDAFGQGIAAYPGNPQIYYDRGLAEMAQGNYRAAILTDGFDSAIRLDAEFTDAYAKRAVAYGLLGETDEAEADMDKAASLGADRAAIQGEIERLKAGGR